LVEMMRSLIHKFSILFVIVFTGSVLAESAQPLHAVPGTPQAPYFSLKDINGKSYDLTEYRGRVVIVNFWTTWCPPCRFELPSMERAYQKFKQQGIEILAINVGEDADTIFTFTVDYPVTFPLLMDLDSQVINNYPVIGLPTTYIIDTEGRLVYRAIGTREWDDPAVMQAVLALKK